MKATHASVLLALSAAVNARPTVDTEYAYTGPEVPVGDWIDPTVNGNGKGFPRLVEPPAVKPASSSPTNNVNVISLSYIPDGMHIHYQTPFGLGCAPEVKWGKHPKKLDKVASGFTHT
jgi:acid phosphatase